MSGVLTSFKILPKIPHNLIPNTFLHVQAEEAMNKQDKKISMLAKNIPVLRNTIMKSNNIRKNQGLAIHIQRTPDYLKPGPVYWWDRKDNSSVEFYDVSEKVKTKECGPHLQHLRSTLIKFLQKQLQDNWHEIYQPTPNLLPVHKLKDEEQKVISQRWQNIRVGIYLEPKFAFENSFRTHITCQSHVKISRPFYFTMFCI